MAGVATFGLLAVIVLLGLPLRTPQAPLGIVSLQFATSPAAAALMLESWSAVPRARLLWSHGLDVLLPIAYVLAIGAAARCAAGPGDRWAGLATGAALVAGVADQVENLAMAFTIIGAPSWTGVLVTLVAATVKSSTLVMALAALALVSFAGRRRHQVTG